MRFAVYLRDSPGGSCRIIHSLNFLIMFELFFALFLAFSCPAHNNNNDNGTVTTQNDTGGEDGHVPPKPPKPPVTTIP